MGTHLATLYEHVRGAAVGRKHWENADPVTALERMQGLHGNMGWICSREEI